jgi:hypothetical protein
MDSLEIFVTSGNTASAGVFIPLSDLLGMTTVELETTGTTLEGHLAYAFLNALHSGLKDSGSLGFPEISKLAPTGAGENRFSEGVTLNIQRLIDLRTGNIGLIPLPTTGENAGLGAVLLVDIWPNCELLLAGISTGEPGVLISHNWITAWGGTIPSVLANDARSWISAFIVALVHSLQRRTTAIPSAITRKTDTTAIRVTGSAVPQEFYDATNPLAGILETDLPYLRLIRESLTVEYEMVVNPANQTLEIYIP